MATTLDAANMTNAEVTQRRLMLTFFNMPDRVISFALGKRPSLTTDGVALDSRTELFMRLAEKTGQVFSPQVDVRTLRAAYVQMNQVFGAQTDEKVLGAAIDERDFTIPVEGGSIAARLYVPRHPMVSTQKAPPLLVYYHGGGFVIGDVDCYDHAARFIAGQALVPVLSIDYRLGPESRFPTATYDAAAAFRWARDRALDLGIDPQRIAVGGDSAGGNLSAGVCHVQLERGEAPPTFQFLIYPAVDNVTPYASRTLFPQGLPLTTAHLTWFAEHYLSNETEGAMPEASPALSPHLAKFPPAYVIVAGFDPLRDEGLAYVKALQAKGIVATANFKPTLSHAFLNLLGILPAARAALMEGSLVLRRALGS